MVTGPGGGSPGSGSSCDGAVGMATLSCRLPSQRPAVGGLPDRRRSSPAPEAPLLSGWAPSPPRLLTGSSPARLRPRLPLDAPSHVGSGPTPVTSCISSLPTSRYSRLLRSWGSGLQHRNSGSHCAAPDSSHSGWIRWRVNVTCSDGTRAGPIACQSTGRNGT